MRVLFMVFEICLGSSIQYVRKIFRKTNIPYSLVGTGTCAYQEVRYVGFSEIFAYLLNGQSLFRTLLYIILSNIVLQGFLIKSSFQKALNLAKIGKSNTTSHFTADLCLYSFIKFTSWYIIYVNKKFSFGIKNVVVYKNVNK